MYAQVVEGHTLPGQSHELERAIREKLLPALRQEEGFCGALHLADGCTGNTMMIVCWETEQQASRAYSEYFESSVVAFAAVAALSAEFQGRFSVWEVNARA